MTLTHRLTLIWWALMDRPLMNRVTVDFDKVAITSDFPIYLSRNTFIIGKCLSGDEKTT